MAVNDIKVVIYARYSSHSQQETSIEGQLKVCYDFCKRNDYTIIREYIDRALSGKSDNRPEFQKMIKDSENQDFQYVIVYQLDRFSRNRYDSAIYKNKLKKHNVRVLSAMENITDDPSGILMESVLEGMAEYYSAELRQKVKRGMKLQAERCLYAGGPPTFGYMVNPDKSYSPDPIASKVVVSIYEQYAKGRTIVEIIDELNKKGIKNYRGNEFAFNSISNMLRNRKYIGEYRFGDVLIPDGMPRIISDDLFNRVANRLSGNKKAPASNRDVQYLLAGKLCCGLCHNNMIGYCGTGKRKIRYYYYLCNGRRMHTCTKGYVKKGEIESYIVERCRDLLEDEIIDRLVDALVKKGNDDFNNSELMLLEKRLADVERKINNLTKTIIDCDIDVVRKNLCAEMPSLEEERLAIESEISKYTQLNNRIKPDIVRKFLIELRDGSYDNDNSRQTLIDTFINKIYVYEDRMTIIYNSGHSTEMTTDEMLAYIEKKTDEHKCSSDNDEVDLKGIMTNTVYFGNIFAITYWFDDMPL